MSEPQSGIGNTGIGGVPAHGHTTNANGGALAELYKQNILNLNIIEGIVSQSGVGSGAPRFIVGDGLGNLMCAGSNGLGAFCDKASGFRWTEITDVTAESIQGFKFLNDKFVGCGNTGRVYHFDSVDFPATPSWVEVASTGGSLRDLLFIDLVFYFFKSNGDVGTLDNNFANPTSISNVTSALFDSYTALHAEDLNKIVVVGKDVNGEIWTIPDDNIATGTGTKIFTSPYTEIISSMVRIENTGVFIFIDAVGHVFYSNDNLSNVIEGTQIEGVLENGGGRNGLVYIPDNGVIYNTTETSKTTVYQSEDGLNYNMIWKDTIDSTGGVSGYYDDINKVVHLLGNTDLYLQTLKHVEV